MTVDALVTVLLRATDPVSALLLAALLFYVRDIKSDIEEEIRRNRERVERLESNHISDD